MPVARRKSSRSAGDLLVMLKAANEELGNLSPDGVALPYLKPERCMTLAKVAAMLEIAHGSLDPGQHVETRAIAPPS